MRRRPLWHWIGLHDACPPARCAIAAAECNRLESEWRMEEYLADRPVFLDWADERAWRAGQPSAEGPSPEASAN